MTKVTFSACKDHRFRRIPKLKWCYHQTRSYWLDKVSYNRCNAAFSLSSCLTKIWCQWRQGMDLTSSCIVFKSNCRFTTSAISRTPASRSRPIPTWYTTVRLVTISSVIVRSLTVRVSCSKAPFLSSTTCLIQINGIMLRGNALWSTWPTYWHLNNRRSFEGGIEWSV